MHKQQRFVDEYAIDLNAAQAYQRAGYKVRSERIAHGCAAKLLRNVAVRAAIDAALRVRAEAANMRATQAWQEASDVAFSDIGDILDFSGAELRLKPVNEIPESALRALKSVKAERYIEGQGCDARTVEVIEFTFRDKPSALHAFLKALGQLGEREPRARP
jgi:phage terminase small subunit